MRRRKLKETKWNVSDGLAKGTQRDFDLLRACAVRNRKDPIFGKEDAVV